MSRILIIDDNAAIRAALCALLEQVGYSVTAIAAGHMAVTLHAATPFDLVITDMFMPDTDGLEVIQQFRLRDPAVKIIAISGGGSRGMVEVLSIAKLMGATRALMKPVGIDLLLTTVEELIGPGRLPNDGHDAVD